MSYTNLAAMASSFETGARLVPAGGAARVGASQAQMEAMHTKAQELIATGCELHATTPAFCHRVTCPCGLLAG